MPDFLLELRCEEIPARMQAGARADLERLFREAIKEAGVSLGEVAVWSTPRRLALIARDLPEATESVREETKGPRTSAPDQALEGFLRKTGLAKDQLTERDGTWFAVVEKPGRAVKEVLAETIPAIVRAFPWPKSMRWGAASIGTESLRWVRPLSGIVAILGEDLVGCEIDGIKSGYATRGHRFHHPGEITIGSAEDYADKLRACHVIVDHEEREQLIREKARHAAHEAGLVLVEDEGLVVENAGLTEWPVPLLGRFDEEFLEVPPEVIQLTARTNQKYFICRTPQGELANAFVCTANIVALDGGEAIVAGNRKVLAARLSDARFFWEQDRRKKLEEHAKGLERITFHEKLGTVADKVERVAKLARWLCEEGIVGSSSPARGGGPPRSGGGGGSPQAQRPSEGPLHHPADGPPPRAGEELAALAEQAARLCKADLTTGMVGEFPELQGVMGGYYARAEGLPDEVADAIRDHYKPVGQGDEVPTAPVTVAVSLADKLDTLVGFFSIGEKPTGSRDPFALRRAAIGVIAQVTANNLRFSLRHPLAFLLVPRGKDFSDQQFVVLRDKIRNIADLLMDFGDEVGIPDEAKQEMLRRRADRDRRYREGKDLPDPRVQKTSEVFAFFADRLKVQQREAGVRHDLIDAVFALGGEDDLVRLLARVRALQEFVGTDDGANLLVAYKRAANILKKEDYSSVAPAQAGAQPQSGMDSRVRGNDEGGQGILQTGDEDPLENVDDPQMREVYAEQIREQRESGLSYTPEPAEKAMMDALATAGPEAAKAVEAEDFAAAMAALATLRGPIDAFFDNVTVNDEDQEKRAARLALLDRFRVAVHNVADFSKIEG